MKVWIFRILRHSSILCKWEVRQIAGFRQKLVHVKRLLMFSLLAGIQPCTVVMLHALVAANAYLCAHFSARLRALKAVAAET